MKVKLVSHGVKTECTVNTYTYTLSSTIDILQYKLSCIYLVYISMLPAYIFIYGMGWYDYDYTLFTINNFSDISM